MSGTGNNFEVPVHVVKPDCFVLAGGDIFFPLLFKQKNEGFLHCRRIQMISKEAKARSCDRLHGTRERSAAHTFLNFAST